MIVAGGPAVVAGSHVTFMLPTTTLKFFLGLLFGSLAALKLSKPPGLSTALPPAINLWGDAAPRVMGLPNSLVEGARCSLRHGILVAAAAAAGGFLKGVCGAGGALAPRVTPSAAFLSTDSLALTVLTLRHAPSSSFPWAVSPRRD